MFSRKFGRRSSNCLRYVDAACFTDIGFCLVSQRGRMIWFGFEWDSYRKPVTTMLVGPSPELELALFTLCFKVRPGSKCGVTLGDTEFEIQTKLDKNKHLYAAYF